MGTSAFDRVWGAGTPPKTAAFDAAWDGPAAPSIHDEFKSGRLQKRMQRENTNDQEQAAVAEPGYASRLATHVLNTAQGIPGMEAVEAGAGALGSQATAHPMGYHQSLDALRGQTGQIGGKTAAAERMMGSLATMPFLPASPAAAGAVLGGADQLLSADPDQSLTERVAKTAGGAAIGGTLGKVGEMGVTGLRALLATGPAKNLIVRQAARAASAQKLYGAAMREGQGKLATAAVKRFLGEPDIAEIVGELQQTRPFANTPAESPEMLDAVYKTLSDRAATLKKGMESISPNRPNIGRFRMADVKTAQQRLLDVMGTSETRTITREVPAIETAQSPAPSLLDAIRAHDARIAEAARRAQGTPLQQNANPFSNLRSELPPSQIRARDLLDRQSAEGIVSPPLSGAPGPRTITETEQLPGVMPGYRAAVADYADRSGGIEGVKKGYDALRTGVANRMPRGANLTRTTPEALTEWGVNANPTEIQGASEGILGGSKMAMQHSLFRDGRRALSQAPSLLRDINSPQQNLIDMLTKLGLTAANASLRP